jgi:hypothetical protein
MEVSDFLYLTFQLRKVTSTISTYLDLGTLGTLAQAAASSILETQQSIAADEADLKANAARVAW